MKKIRINVVGAGHWGPNLVRNFSSIAGVSVGMVADLDPRKLERLEQNFPVATTTDPAAAIEDPDADAIAIVTPVSTHFELGLRALLAGKDLFVEKPMCSTLEEADVLIDLAQKGGLTLMVGHVFVFNPGINKIKEILDSGVIGRILYIDAVRTNL